jgi:hypothetical protein
MTTVSIPASITEATSRLEGIDALLTAKGWERAAIVYAFTEDAQGSNQYGSSIGENSSKLSLTAFADLGINGLKSRDSVRLYRTLWEEHGDPITAPGMMVELPTIDFPPTRTGTNGVNTPEGAVKRVDEMDTETRAAVVAAIAKTDPDALVEAMDTDGEVESAINKASALTDNAKRHYRDMERHVKGIMAEREEAGPQPVSSAMALGVMWTVHPFITAVYESPRTAEAIATASNMVGFLNNAATQIQAWVNGELEPLNDEEFQAAINALVDEG